MTFIDHIFLTFYFTEWGVFNISSDFKTTGLVKALRNLCSYWVSYSKCPTDFKERLKSNDSLQLLFSSLETLHLHNLTLIKDTVHIVRTLQLLLPSNFTNSHKFTPSHFAMLVLFFNETDCMGIFFMYYTFHILKPIGITKNIHQNKWENCTTPIT